MATEGDPIKYSDLVVPGTFEQFAEDSDMVLAHFQKLEQGIKDAMAPLKQKLAGNIVSVKDLNDQSAAIDKTKAAYEGQIQILREKQKIEQENYLFKQKEKAAEKELAEEKKKTAKATADANKISREEATILKNKEKLAKSAAGSYNELSARLSLVSARWKTLSERQRENTVTGKMLEAEKLSLTNKLKALDASTGVHVRNVGNYHGAIKKLEKGLGGLTGVLSLVGRMFGIDTEALQSFSEATKEVIQVSKDLRDVSEANAAAEKLRGNAVRETTAAVNENTIVEEANIAATETTVASTEAEIVASEGSVVATEAETVATEELAAAQMATPWGLIIGAVIALGLAIAATIVVTERQKKAEEERSKAIDGVIIKDKQLRETHNQSIYTLQRLQNEYRLLTGEISKYEQIITNIDIETNEALTKLKDDTNEKIGEATGFWHEFWSVVSPTGKNFGPVNQFKNVMDPMRHVNEEVATIKADADRQALDLQKEHDAKVLLEQKKHEQTILMDDMEFQKSRLEGQRISLETSGGNTIAIRKQILDQERKIAEERVQTEDNAVGKMFVILQNYLNDVAALDKEYAEQRRRALSDANQMRIDAMEDGFIKDYAQIKENYRKEREQIVYDTELTETERREHLRLLREKYDAEELRAIKQHQEEVRQMQLEGQRQTLEDTVTFYNRLIREDQQFRDYQLSMMDAINVEEGLRLRAKYQNGEISQKEYNDALYRNDVAAAEQRRTLILEEDAAEKKRLEDKLAAIAALPNSAEKDKAAQETLAELEALQRKTDLDIIESDNAVTQAKLDNQEKIRAAHKETVDKQLTDLNKLTDAVARGLDQRYQAEMEAMSFRTALIDSELQTQATLFAAGLENNLDAQKALRAKATEDMLREAREAEKRKQAVELAHTYISFVQSYLKEGKDPKAAAVEALAQTLIVQGVVDAIAGRYKDGVENLEGPGTETSDSIVARLSRGESVATAQATRETPGLVSAINEDGYDGAVDWAMQNIYKPNFAASIASDDIGGKANTEYALMLQLNTTIEKSIERGFSKMKITNYSKDAMGKLIEEEMQNGISKTFIHHGPIFPPNNRIC